MAALAQDRRIPQVMETHLSGYIIDAPVGATEQIFQGSFVTSDGSDKFAAALVAGDSFWGISLENVLGGSANGDKTVKILCESIFQASLGSAALASLGLVVYATDDQTLNLTNDGSDTPVGRIVSVPATGTIIVKCFEPRPAQTEFVAGNFTEDYVYDADAAAPVAGDVVTTLIRDLAARGIIQGTVTA